MSTIKKELESILRTVEKPSRYIGGEWNSIKRDPGKARLKIALCFPDLYEIGMSHLGFRILYSLLNAHDDILAERVFMPWTDMQKEMKARKIPLFSLENQIPLNRFDIVGFSLQYELNYTNILAMLDLGDIPLRSDERDETTSLVIAGGPAAFNPEPLARFIDLFIIGDGEEAILEFIDLYVRLKSQGAHRDEIIREAANLPGMYAPALYGIVEKNGLSVPIPGGSAPYPVRKRIVMDIDSYPFPESIIVPHCEIVHDRISFEIMRGCITGCRFCQAGYIYRPRRERDPLSVREAVRRSAAQTGYEEVSLTSLNSGEYGGIRFLLSSLMEDFSKNATSLSLPSLKPSSLTEDIVREIRKVRKTGFTIAPEAATARLRAVINKDINEEHILKAAETAFMAGWRLIKLYFIIGLPTETQEDIQEIVTLVRKILKKIRESSGRGGRINVSLSSFIPKPHTPFQWLPMENIEELERKQAFIKERLVSGSVRVKWHNTRMSFLEAVISRGDRKLGEAIEKAYTLGCTFDGWTDRFDQARWMEAFESSGLDPAGYAYRRIEPDDELPWDIIDTAIRKSFLKEEMVRALRGEKTSACGIDNCYGCAAFAKECKQIMDASLSRTEGAEARSAESPISAEVPGEYRYRVRYEKKGRMKFISHLDLTRTIIRGMRRAAMPFVFSRGFNPLPKVSFGPALPVGVESNAEYLDFYSKEYIDEESFPDRINRHLPEGIAFKRIKSITRMTHSLSESLNLAHYSVSLEGEAVDDRIASMIGQLHDRRMPEAVEVESSLWPPGMAQSIREIYLEGKRMIKIMLYIAGKRKGKLSDVLKVLTGDGGLIAHAVREELFMEREGRIYSPFLLNDPEREHVERDDS